MQHGQGKLNEFVPDQFQGLDALSLLLLGEIQGILRLKIPPVGASLLHGHDSFAHRVGSVG